MMEPILALRGNGALGESRGQGLLFLAPSA